MHASLMICYRFNLHVDVYSIRASRLCSLYRGFRYSRVSYIRILLHTKKNFVGLRKNGLEI